MTDAHLWWYVARATGLIGWVLLTASVLWGIALSTRFMRRFHRQGWLQDTHRFLGGLGLLFVGIHLLSLMLDPWLHFTAIEALIPGAATYRTVPVAIGIVAAYCMVAVYVTALAMNRLPRRAWKTVHYLSYVTVLAVAVHAALTGTDVNSWWYRILAVTLIGATTAAVITRVIMGNAASRSAARTGTLISSGPAPAVLRQPEFVLEVVAISSPAEGVRGIRFARSERSPLPTWNAGAHITLHLPDGLERQYSLCGDPADRLHYDIAVRDSDGPGSEFVHRHLATGMHVGISGPANHFPLEPAKQYLFIAGGIGITPIKAMIESLPAHRAWHLLYFGKTRAQMAFANELYETYPGRVTLVESGAGQRTDLKAWIASAPEAQIYLCGPESLIDEAVTVADNDRIHFERFTPIIRTGLETPFTITAARSHREIPVAGNQSALDALAQAGITVPRSCGRGICGTCEVTVLAGTPQHLDSVMADTDKDRLAIMYPCVSRATDGHLTLDV